MTQSIQTNKQTGPVAKANASNAKVQEFIQKIQILAQLKIDGSPIVASEQYADATTRTKTILSWGKDKKLDAQSLKELADLIRSELKNGKLVRSNDGYIDLPSDKLQELINQVQLRRMPAHERASVNPIELSRKNQTEEAKAPIPKPLNLGNAPEIEQIKKAAVINIPGVKTSAGNLAQLIIDTYKMQKIGALA